MNRWFLELDRCPHCEMDRPHLRNMRDFETKDYQGRNHRLWGVYSCDRCGGMVVASCWFSDDQRNPLQIFHDNRRVDSAVPNIPKRFLEQAISTIQSHAASIMVAASSVDAMLKEKGYSAGTLNSRIKKASEDHLITDAMEEWAHEVRILANEQRHDDRSVAGATIESAERTLQFALALAEYLFVLPARVEKGRHGET